MNPDLKRIEDKLDTLLDLFGKGRGGMRSQAEIIKMADKKVIELTERKLKRRGKS
jgi:hypothetical protein